MTARQWLIVAAVGAVSIVFAVVLFTGLSRLLRTPAPAPSTSAPDAPNAPNAPDSPAVPRIKATLYFASEDGMRLVPAEQEVPLAEGVMAQARAIVEAQLAAQPPAPLASTIPQGARLRAVFISERNEAFVDLDATIRTAHPGGTLQELMTVYTIVNAVLTNLPTLQQVQLLIDGQEVDTLAGHVDLRRPLRKNEGLILSSVTPPPPPTQ